MSNISKRRKEGAKAKIKTMGNHQEFLKRIERTLYYGTLPTLPCLSLPVTEISCSLWSVSQRGRSLRRLRAAEAAEIARGACVSPCALVLAILYLERLNACNPDYLANTAPADLFLVSLMVSNKFLQDDGEDDEVICAEWAASGGIQLKYLKKLELDFLNAIDWRVYVSEEEFEVGLLWLEREAALRQAARRGWCTYGELARLARPLLAPAATAAAATLAALAAYLAALSAVLASSMLLWHAVIPTPTNTTTSPQITTEQLGPSSSPVTLTNFNATVQLSEADVAEPLRCCTKWLHYQETDTHKDWQYGLTLDTWSTTDAWWSNTPVLNWLYQRSLINPQQRWLEKMTQFGEFMNRELFSAKTKRCDGHHMKQNGYVNQWLDLSNMGALLATVTDR